jgi:hypothetical protein
VAQGIEVFVKNEYWGPVGVPKLTGPIQNVAGEHKSHHPWRSNEELLLSIGHEGFFDLVIFLTAVPILVRS